MSIKRFVPSAGLAVGVTIGTGLVMAAMIATEFMPQDKTETLGFEINPVVEDIIIQPDRVAPTLHKKVETPPPPPIIAREKSAQPQERIASVTGAIPDFVAPKIDPQTFTIRVSDRDALPLVRIAPIMPPRAEKSGHCDVRFDVSPEGSPFNITTFFCTQSIFKSATVKSIQKWKYNPKMVEGRAVSRAGVVNRVSYRLLDERGNEIPE